MRLIDQALLLEELLTLVYCISGPFGLAMRTGGIQLAFYQKDALRHALRYAFGGLHSRWRIGRTKLAFFQLQLRSPSRSLF